jgi:hypothetical protein
VCGAPLGVAIKVTDLNQQLIRVVEFAIITAVFLFSLWAVATSHNNEAASPDRTWIVD